jgi:hypothetical protein
LKQNYRSLITLKLTHLTCKVQVLKKRQEEQWIQRYPTIRLIPTSVHPQIHVSWWNKKRRKHKVRHYICNCNVLLICDLNFGYVFCKLGLCLNVMLYNICSNYFQKIGDFLPKYPDWFLGQAVYNLLVSRG